MLQDLIGLRTKEGVASMLTAPPVGSLVARVCSDRIPYRGFRIQTDHAAVSSRVKASIFWRIYESAESRFISGLLRQDLDVIELGSSIGVTTCLIHRRLRPEYRVLCVEANPSIVPLLRRNLAANMTGRNYNVVHAAVTGEERDTANLELGDSYQGCVIDGAANDGTEVPATTLSALVHRFQARRYALVADIEGSEAGVLSKDAAALDNCEQLIIELHGTVLDGIQLSVDDLKSMLHTLGFRERATYGPVGVFERPE